MYKNHPIASNLFMQANFEKYEKNFPHVYFDQTVEAYPFLNTFKLIIELQVINDF